MKRIDPGPIRYIVQGRVDLAKVLGDIRVGAGLTLEQFDAYAGVPDRWTSKAELSPHKPAKRWGLTAFAPGRIELSDLGDVWLQACGLRLVLVDEQTAKAIGAVPCPKKQPGERRPRMGQGSPSKLKVA